jgi:ankyrin repeat protein
MSCANRQSRLLSASVILLILSLTFNPVVASADIDSELMDAIRLKDTQQIKEAITKGAHADAHINSIEQSNVTPLMLAAASLDSSVEIGKILIQKGADVNAKDLLGWTPLIYAAYHGQTEFAALLIEKGADLNARSNVGWTPLMYAAFSGRAEVGKLLIAKGAVVNLASRDGKTALSIAESRGRSDFADLLRKLNAK